MRNIPLKSASDSLPNFDVSIKVVETTTETETQQKLGTPHVNENKFITSDMTDLTNMFFELDTDFETDINFPVSIVRGPPKNKYNKKKYHPYPYPDFHYHFFQTSAKYKMNPQNVTLERSKTKFNRFVMSA